MGNGLCERFNQSLLKMLGTLEEEKKADWKSHVGPLVHAYNVTPHPSTGYSPYYLMFGRQPKLAVDALLGLNTDDISAKSKNEYVRKLRDRLSLAYKKAKENALSTAETNKVRYDLKARASNLRPGDLVLTRNVTIRGKQKIADKWEQDPYIVLTQPFPDQPVYDVKKNIPNSRRVRRLHRNLLLPLGLTSEGPDKSDEHNDVPKYVIPQRRASGDAMTNSDFSTVDLNAGRSKRISRPPNWKLSDEWVF